MKFIHKMDFSVLRLASKYSRQKNLHSYLSLDNNVSLSGQSLGVEVVIVEIKVRLVLRVVCVSSDEFAVKFLGQDKISDFVQPFGNAINVQVRQYPAHRWMKPIFSFPQQD